MKKLLNTILFLNVSLFLFSQNTNNDTVINLSLEKCVEMAVESSFDLKIAEQTLQKAQAEKAAALSLYFPKVAANASTTYMFEDLKIMQSIDGIVPPFDISGADIPDNIKGQVQDGLNELRSEIVGLWKPIEVSVKGAFFAGITLQQPIYAGGRIAAGNKMAKTGVDMANENLKLKKSEAVVEAQKMYWLYVSVREKVKLVKSYQSLLEELEKLLTNVLEVEMINRNELLKLQVQHNAVKLQAKQAQTGLELSRMALCQMIGIGYGSVIIPTDTIVEMSQFKELPSSNAVMERPEYKLMQKIIQMKDGEMKLVRGEYLPTFALTATYGYMGNLEIMGGKDKPHNISNVMGVVSVPLTAWWEGKKKIKSAKTNRTIAQLELDKNSQLMELEIKQATYNAVNAYESVKNAELALEQAKENLRISTDRYSVQMETITDLMMAQSGWQTAYSNLIDARIDYRIKEIEFLKAIGKLE